MVVVIAISCNSSFIDMYPNLLGQKKKAETKTGDAFKVTIQTQVELYKDDKGKLPASFDELVKNDYLTEDQKKKAEEKKYSINKDGEVEISKNQG